MGRNASITEMHQIHLNFLLLLIPNSVMLSCKENFVWNKSMYCGTVSLDTQRKGSGGGKKSLTPKPACFIKKFKLHGKSSFLQDPANFFGEIFLSHLSQKYNSHASNLTSKIQKVEHNTEFVEQYNDINTTKEEKLGVHIVCFSSLTIRI